MTILRNNVPSRFVNGFSKSILRPNNTFGYAPPGVAERGHRLLRAGNRTIEPRGSGRARAAASSLCLHAMILATYDLWAFVSDELRGAAGRPPQHAQGVGHGDRGRLRDRPRARRGPGAPDPGDQPVHGRLRRGDPEHADPPPDLHDLLRAPAVRDRLRPVHGGVALRDDLGRRLQQRELPRRLPGGGVPLPGGRLRARLREPRDFSQRDAADRRPDRTALVDQHVHLGAEEHLADVRDRLCGADDDGAQHQQPDARDQGGAHGAGRRLPRACVVAVGR